MIGQWVTKAAFRKECFRCTMTYKSACNQFAIRRVKPIRDTISLCPMSRYRVERFPLLMARKGHQTRFVPFMGLCCKVLIYAHLQKYANSQNSAKIEGLTLDIAMCTSSLYLWYRRDYSDNIRVTIGWVHRQYREDYRISIGNDTVMIYPQYNYIKSISIVYSYIIPIRPIIYAILT